MDNVVFGTTSLKAEPFVLASPKGQSVVLKAGRVHGMTKGSEFDIYPPGTKKFSEPNKPIARAKLSKVEAYQSTT